MEDKSNILVVDDNPTNLQVLSGMLKERGCKVRVVTSGPLALRAAAHDTPDLILLDINMPDMDGYEVCRRLKQDEDLSAVPVIFLSALTETEDKVQAFTVGGLDYITKPFQFEEVEARIEIHLRLRRLQREVEEQNRRLEESYDRLQDLEELRDSLVHMIVHDMRSPLGAITTSLQLLKEDLEGDIPAENLNDIEAAMTGGDALMRLLNDLLDVSRLESGKMPLDIHRNDLVTLAKRSMVALKGLAPGRDVSIHGLEEVWVECDGEVVRRVVDNLVANGLKHTPAGATLRITVQKQEKQARIEVFDSGPGIPKDHLDRIFDKFSQVKTRKSGKYHSTGIGLTFCKMAVEAHGGDIGVESEMGEGSTFWFSLPLSPPRD